MLHFAADGRPHEEAYLSNETATGRIQFSTTHRNGAFIRWAWLQRASMSGEVREGMVQALYASLTGHVEGLLADALLSEYRQAMSVVNHHLGHSKETTLQMVSSTVLQLVDARRVEIEKMPYDKLMAEAELAFGERFASARVYKPDLSAMRHLRNVFVHGRVAWLPLAAVADARIDTNQNPLQQAIDQLIRAGVLSSADLQTKSEFMAEDEARLFSKLHADEAVMYFYKAAKGFEAALAALPGLPIDTLGGTSLPDLSTP